jgi:hypothetical protein
MPRKPSDIVAPNLRIREDLRRRLEQAAQKRGVSLNFEMTERLKASLDQGDRVELAQIASTMKSTLGRLTRFAREGRDRARTQELMRASEELVRATEAQDREAMARAATWVREATTAIARNHGRTYDSEPGEE